MYEPPEGWCRVEGCRIEGAHAAHEVIKRKVGRPRIHPPRVKAEPKPKIPPCEDCQGTGKKDPTQVGVRGAAWCKHCVGKGRAFPRKYKTALAELQAKVPEPNRRK